MNFNHPAADKLADAISASTGAAVTADDARGSAYTARGPAAAAIAAARLLLAGNPPLVEFSIETAPTGDTIHVYRIVFAK